MLMIKLLQFMLAALTALCGAVFAVLNPDRLRLDFLFVTVEMPIAIVLSLAVLTGALLGAAAVLAIVVRQQRVIVRLRQGAMLVNAASPRLRRDASPDWLD